MVASRWGRDLGLGIRDSAQPRRRPRSRARFRLRGPEGLPRKLGTAQDGMGPRRPDCAPVAPVRQAERPRPPRRPRTRAARSPAMRLLALPALSDNYIWALSGDDESAL